MTGKAVLALVAFVALGACGAATGGNGKTAYVNKCVDGGEKKEVCTCVVDEMEKAMDPEVFKAMMLEGQGKSEEAQKIMSGLPLGKQLSAATGMLGVMAKCQAAK